MANDAITKPTTNESTLSNAIDQQKVPPLRIVLNSAGNQKTSSAATTIVTSVAKQQANSKKEKAQDAKTEGTVKVGGRVRIKLGTSKQAGGNNGGNKTTDSTGTKANGGSTTNDKLIENINEDSASSFNHLRRITRRSHRTVQSTANEDEESISSMTSTDENLNTNNNLSSGDNITQDSEQSNSAALTSSSATPAASSATNGSTNADTPRRHKRRKIETSDSQSIDCDNLLGSQNYRLPHQNSFELFKNIRKQVDRRLKNLNNVAPRTPHGFRDYMLTRGAYLLEGNKLGNGTNLFMNEDGGLNSVPAGKYRVLRHSTTSYSVPDRAKVPLGLPVNSPLYDLFVEQEKERYRMRIQHIKEREKLTLTAEQEFIRVYNRAALAAAEQSEPFSACTMLKHQEIYNYMDTNGLTILSKEDALQDQVQSDGVRTRRRHHEHISPSATTGPSDADQTNISEQVRIGPRSSASPTHNQKVNNDTQESGNYKDNDLSPEKETRVEESDDKKEGGSAEGKEVKNDNLRHNNVDKETSGICPISPPDRAGADLTPEEPRTGDSAKTQSEIKTEDESPAQNQPTIDESKPHSKTEDFKQSSQIHTEEVNIATPELNPATVLETGTDPDAQVVMSKAQSNESVVEDVGSLMEDKKAQYNEQFLSKLQEVDDKWEQIRHEMLVRHRNEAQSLHAIQKLEWEWKTKETGACDVRTTLIIDDTLVPRLDIQSQDY